MPILTLGNPALYDTGSSILEPPTTSSPELPNLYIKDAQTGQTVPVGGVHGWSDDYIQTMSIHKAPMQFVEILDTNIQDTYSHSFWCHRISTLVINAYFTDNTASAEIRLILADSNDILTITDVIQLNAINIQVDDTYYFSSMTTFDSFGANYFGIYLQTLSSGSVKIYVAGV